MSISAGFQVLPHPSENGAPIARSSIVKTNPYSKRGAPDARPGKVGWILLWLIGIPVPVLLVLFLLRGCT